MHLNSFVSTSCIVNIDLKMFFMVYVSIFLTIFLPLCQCDLTVAEYNQLINDYIAATSSFQYPNSSRDFVNGTYENGCPNDGGTFDFIIVGGGSSGSVITNRLSEKKEWNILLLEAGGEENAISDIPFMFEYIRMSDMNWAYKSVPQNKSLLSLLNHQGLIPRGKVLGGTSVLNAMMYVRGNKADYDKWFKLGNPGWSYTDVLPLFKKSENATLPLEGPGYHGHNGRLHVQSINKLTCLTQLFLDATKELGSKYLDYNGRSQMGVSTIQTTMNKGRRFSGNKAFIAPARNRTNLVIRTHALVTKILLEHKVAKGVQYMKDGKTYCAYAKKEVILSAGVFNSPQLLMLSGIGPAKHLQEKGISLVKNLPVGEGMWDHFCMPVIPFTTNMTVVGQSQNVSIEQYLAGYGPFTVPDAIQDIDFKSIAWTLRNVPDVEYIFRAAKVPPLPYGYFEKFKNFNPDMYNYVIKPLIGNMTWSMFALLLHPKSRGTVKLKSNSPLDYPVIDPNYFSDPDNTDLKTLIASVKYMIQISKTSSMQTVNSQMFNNQLPACQQFSFGTDEYYKCLIQNLGNTIHHFAGTCKMGPFWDDKAVVDPELRVYGISRLRVADCSVFPVTISGHNNAPAFMVGEKASEMIKNSWFAFG